MKRESKLLERVQGKKFERLSFTGHFEFVYTETAKRKYKNLFGEFLCDCGNKKLIPIKSVLDGHSKSCGCYNAERISTHKLSKTKIYIKWIDMKTRCLNPQYKHYHRYGGRGITIHPDWINDFESFKDWAYANGYNDKLSLERDNNDLGYSPENCSWITMKQQAQNRCNNQKFLYNNEYLTISVISQLTKIDRASLDKKLKKGMTIDEIIATHKTYKKRKQ